MEKNRRLGDRMARFNPSSSSSSSNISSTMSSRNRDRNPPLKSKTQEASDRWSASGEIGVGDAESVDRLPFLVGTCPDMCPAKERAERERTGDLTIFERLDGNPRKTSSSLAVKKFCRTISSQNVRASDIRPLTVLQDTSRYIFKLLESSDYPFEVVYEFVFDRTRSIRQDLSMQNITSKQAIDIYEQIVKFHIISQYKLLPRSGETAISSVLHLNLEQLIKSLQTLYNLYSINQSSELLAENEAEFYSFYVLLNLSSKSLAMGESLATWFWRLESLLLHSQEMLLARSLLRSFRMNNYQRFFCIAARHASYLQLCLIVPLFNEVRAQAISCINQSSYKLHPYPVSHLAKILIMEEPEMESFCRLCALEITVDEAGNKFVPTKQTSFGLPKGGFPQYNFPKLVRYFQFGASSTILISK